MKSATMILLSVMILFLNASFLPAQEKEASEASSKEDEKDKYTHRMSTMDGDSITGVLKVKDIKIKTQFGSLVVPVDDVVAIIPGLKNQPKVKKDFTALVNELGHKDKNLQEKAFGKIMHKGPRYIAVLKEIQKEKLKQKDQNKTMIEKLARLVENFKATIDEMDSAQRKNVILIYEDRLIAKKFEIVGEVLQKSFIFTSAHGELKVDFADLKRLSLKSASGALASVKKSYSITANENMQTTKDTGLRVQPGDLIKISATGNIHLSSWGYSTGPDGNANSVGMVGSYASGTLLARVGKKGAWVKIGVGNKFRVKKGGKLELAIAFNTRYTRHGTTGNYDVQVKVESAESK
jgi:hypothetical protein